MEKIKIDATIIGGGIIGLMTAYELKKNHPEWEIALIEAAPFLGDHSTGRNSGVLHAGLYYPTNSNKHLMCLEGIELWKKDLCPKLGIDFLECGKILFAKNQNEEEGLTDIWNKANENGVKDLKWLTTSQLSEAREHIHAHRAFFSPHTGVLDVTGAIKKIADAFEQLGGMIAKNCEVTQISKGPGFHLVTPQFEIQTDYLINAAGLYGPDLRRQLGLTNLKSVLVKGNYLSTSQKLNHPHLFYPVPPKDLKGLGVHSTLDIEGKIKFGPNTEDVTHVDYADSGMAYKAMVPEIMKTFVGVDESRLYWDYAGIRSKVMNLESGKIESDFWIQSPLEGYIECLGIESPGLTSAPAIARKVSRTFLAS